MQQYTLIKKIIVPLTLTLMCGTLYAAPNNTPVNTNWKIGAGVNIDNVTKQNSKYPTKSDSHFNNQTQTMSDPGFTLVAIKPISERVSFRIDYTQVGNVVQKNNAPGKTDQQAIIKNSYVDLLGLYAYPMTNHLDMVGTAGITYNMNSQKANAAAVADSQESQNSNAGIGVTYGAGLQYHVGSATVSLIDMLPPMTDGYFTLDFLFQL